MPALTNTGPAPRSPPWGWPGFGILAWIVACTDPTRPADAAIALRPGLKVLYTSGYTQNAIVHHGRLDPGVQLLSKPYRRRDLALKLRSMLSPE